MAHTPSNARVEQFVARAAHSHFMQSTVWLSGFADERESVDHVVTEDASGAIVGCSGVRRVRGRAWTGEKCFVDGGPVFDSESQLDRHMADLTAATDGASLVRIRPYLAQSAGTRLRELLGDHSFTLLSPEQQSGYSSTLVLDLTRSLETLQAGFSVGLRRNLRRMARLGVEAERIEKGPVVAEFSQMLAGAARFAGYDVPPAARITHYLENLFATDPTAGALFCARENAQLRAGIVVLRAGKSLVYQWGARSDPGSQGGAPLAHALHWEAIRWGRSKAFEQYDFGGLTESTAPNGIDRFKQAFGGERQKMFGEAIRTRGLWDRVMGARPVRHAEAR
jgi:hypothetical protein